MPRTKKQGLSQIFVGDIELAVSWTYYPGHPGSFYQRNGDPGNPPEEAELEFSSIVLVSHGVEILPLLDALDGLEHGLEALTYIVLRGIEEEDEPDFDPDRDPRPDEEEGEKEK